MLTKYEILIIIRLPIPSCLTGRAREHSIVQILSCLSCKFFVGLLMEQKTINKSISLTLHLKQDLT